MQLQNGMTTQANKLELEWIRRLPNIVAAKWKQYKQRAETFLIYLSTAGSGKWPGSKPADDSGDAGETSLYDSKKENPA